MKKLISLLLIIALVIPSSTIFADNNKTNLKEGFKFTSDKNSLSKSRDSEEEELSNYYSIGPYKREGNYPTKSGKTFAGWYQDQQYTTPRTQSFGAGYAKFINEKVLTTKFQYANDGSAIRFLSTVDNTDYSEVGFIFHGKYKGFSINKITKNTIHLYTAIKAEGASIRPSVFNEQSKYFFAYTIRGMENASENSSWSVTPFFVTLDGTKVYGKTAKINMTDEDEFENEALCYETFDAAITDLNEGTNARAMENMDAGLASENEDKIRVIKTANKFDEATVFDINQNTTIRNTITIEKPIGIIMDENISLTLQQSSSKIIALDNLSFYGQGTLNIVHPYNRKEHTAISCQGKLEAHQIKIVQDTNIGNGTVFEALNRFIIANIKFANNNNNEETMGYFLIGGDTYSKNQEENYIIGSTFEFNGSQNIDETSLPIIYYIGMNHDTNSNSIYIMNNTFKDNTLDFKGGIVGLFSKSQEVNYLIKENEFIVKNPAYCIAIDSHLIKDENLNNGAISQNIFYTNKNAADLLIVDMWNAVFEQYVSDRFLNNEGNIFNKYEDYTE